jgi:sugar-phosphatase
MGDAARPVERAGRKISSAGRVGGALRIECSAILFDLDGVLIDSTSCVERHWRNWAERHALDAARILRIAHGVRNIDTMRRVAPQLDAETEAALFAANEVADTEGVLQVDGAGQAIADLQGSRWAIVTSCGAALAHSRLQASRLPLPPLLITGDDVPRGKPEPHPYLAAAKHFGLGADDCVVVEDAPAGIQAGKSAGMQVIGIAFTYGRDDLVARGADLVVSRLTQLRFRQVNGGNRLRIEVGSERE